MHSKTWGNALPADGVYPVDNFSLKQHEKRLRPNKKETAMYRRSVLSLTLALVAILALTVP
ncbi:MAG TPA: hypothetical protein VJ768_07900, partial [Anaerolineales bacterium]|nr:hypothetical protein [Anaerolineales bacterium]